ncbi:hypothetical protein [Rhodobacter sp. 24-YEA-8]|uniref:hypothetical protein n=1 Tax=Rhodobacter sp. 24-YEA-8 TaxID=1884310 RepID=UPI00089A87E0|nr:hypothetical protein [Rhodobacter sp. 24-YEA-8]SEB46042.1 hypothetical protein SAMN05519105_0372 [Rhodobacter sp. 24-YEA-8]
MKPDFALNFTDTSIALLHRTAKGWLKIGETPFDASDLEDALDYMRKTALGLSPGGFTTKLVIPASQILYTEVDISGGDDARTAQEITNALVSRTPYRPDEIVWDWLRGEGRTARVAAVARETLAEAEAFATTHKFSPVAFVAIPDESEFDGEPWFGEAADARNFLADGEEIERDSAAILLIDEARAARRRAKAARQAEIEAASQSESHPEAEAESNDAATAAQDWPATGATATAEAEQQPAAQPAAESPPDEARASPSVEEAPEVAPGGTLAAAAVPTAAREAQAELPLHADNGFDEPAPFARTAAPAPAAAPVAQAPGPRVTITEITPLGSVAAPAAEPSVAPPAPVATSPRVNLTAGVVQAPVSPAVSATVPAPTAVPAAPAASPVEADPDEAPFAHVPDSTTFPEADEAPDLPPLPHLARRMAGLTPAAGQPAAPGPLARASALNQASGPASAPRVQPAVQTAAAGKTADLIGEPDDDLPPAPSAATLAAYSRSGRGAQITAPHSARASAPQATAGDDARAAPAPTATSTATPGAPAGFAAPARNAGAAGAAARTARGAGGLAGLITAPSIPGTRKTRAQSVAAGQMPAGARPRAADGTDDAARSLSQSPFATRNTRGKPRFLGLILTAILLLCLALVAAWSSFYLSSNRTSGEEETQFAATTADEGSTVSVDDEMLADGLDPEAEGETTQQVATNSDAADMPDAATDPAPETALESESPAAVALLDAEDEIFLSSSDAPPPAFDALSLPGPDTSAEAPPGAPMPPPPFGTVYRYDENQMLMPTAAGLPTPGGYMLFEGKPPRVPPPRSAAATEAAIAATAAASAPAAPPAPAAAPEASSGTAPGSAAASAGETAAAPAGATGNPSLAGGAVGTAPATVTAATTEPVAQPDPELADRRPRARPDRPATDDDAALQPATAPVDFAGLRPRQRPAIVEAASAKARADTAAASLANEEEVQLASATVPATAGLSAAELANPSLMTISRRPAARPQDFSRAIEAAVAAAVRSPEPAPAPVEIASAPAPQPAPKGKAAAKPEEHDEIDEPEVASGPAPSIPTKASVAKQATYAKAINLSKINLIGVYGQPSKRYALVRTANGKYHKVSVGDRIDGGQVRAITQNEVRYQKGGRLVALEMPKG